MVLSRLQRTQHSLSARRLLSLQHRRSFTFSARLLTTTSLGARFVPRNFAFRVAECLTFRFAPKAIGWTRKNRSPVTATKKSSMCVKYIDAKAKPSRRLGQSGAASLINDVKEIKISIKGVPARPQSGHFTCYLRHT